MRLTREQFKHVFPNAKDVDELCTAMEKLFPKYDITTAKREAGFLAQCGHESGGFRVKIENLNYSAKALDGLFGKYFKRGGRDATEYERQPEKIANVVYADRMDNGDTASGDGWRFRGRGYIQLTGRYNYTKFSESIGKSLEDTIEYLETVEGALESALWFWKENNINKYADNGDIKGMTKRINGGYNGLEDRQHHWDELLELMGEKTETPKSNEPKTVEEKLTRLLRRGDRGDDVKELQRKLGVTPLSGVFGGVTEKAVKKFQARNGLTRDGIVGPKTFGKMG